ncbi:MAG: phosphotransferase [Pseudomonadota bacterium]
MQLPKKISDNLHFLIVEVRHHLNSLNAYFDTHADKFKNQISQRNGYVYNLKMGIHNSCLSHYTEQNLTGFEHVSLKSIELIATNLERITDICRVCIEKSSAIKKQYFHLTDELTQLIKQVENSLYLIEPAIFEGLTESAIKIGHVKKKIDKKCTLLMEESISLLKQETDTESLIAFLFVINEFEHIAEKLLNISEAIISANLGHSINFERYFFLQLSIEQLKEEQNTPQDANILVETIAQTRSGSAISGLSLDKEKNQYLAIYKDGKKHKLKKERKGIKSWHDIYPGIAPKVLNYHKQGQSASLLIEHLDGLTFEQILITSSSELLKKALKQLNKTLQNIWLKSKSEQGSKAHFMQQLLHRLDDVYAVHPEFINAQETIGKYQATSFAELVEQAKKIEAQIAVPFAVYIHGDFNLDNIIYQPEQKRINFIDLHRSKYMDYVQDVSVFMVSNYRMQILDTPIRHKILSLAYSFYCFARKFAKKQNDETFELRLALGLARSFVTSTRFILDKSLARAMFYRSRYIIEQVIKADLTQPKQFKLAIEDIFVG